MSSRIERILNEGKISDLPKRTICKVEASTPLDEVYRLLDEEQTVAVLVTESEEIVGIFTERDILNRTALESDRATPIGELMTRGVTTTTGDASIADAIRTMDELGVRHVPLLAGGNRPEGLIGGRDILKLIAEHYPEALLNLPPRLHQRLVQPEGG